MNFQDHSRGGVKQNQVNHRLPCEIYMYSLCHLCLMVPFSLSRNGGVIVLKGDCLRRARNSLLSRE